MSGDEAYTTTIVEAGTVVETNWVVVQSVDVVPSGLTTSYIVLYTVVYPGIVWVSVTTVSMAVSVVVVDISCEVVEYSAGR